MPADPPCPDLDALEQALAKQAAGTGDYRAALVNALPGLIAEVKRLRAALERAAPILAAAGALADTYGIGVEACDISSAADDVADAARAWRASAAAEREDRLTPMRALAVPARTDKATHVLVHADGGRCHGSPIVNGRCSGCGIAPDTQSTELRATLPARGCR